MNWRGLRFQRPFAAPEGPGSLDVDVPQLAASLPEQLWQAGPSALASHLDAAKLLAPLFTESAACNALLRAFREQGKTWEGLLDWVCLRQDLDLVREQAEQVQIMTLHAAKGLEFRAVFLPALEEGILPFPRRGMRCFTATPAALSTRTRSRKSGACSMSA